MTFRNTEAEADLLVDTRWLLDLLTRIGLLTYTRIHVMPIIRGRGRFSKNEDMKGFSDIEVVVPGGRVGYLELKSERGKLSEDQIRFIESRERMGCICRVPRHLDDVIQFLRDMGVSVDGVLKGLKAGGSSRRAGDTVGQGVPGRSSEAAGEEASGRQSLIAGHGGRDEADDEDAGDGRKAHRKPNGPREGADFRNQVNAGRACEIY